MKRTQCFNPFLPLSECIPDGEPHVFGDRIYIFGSHERLGGDKFCCLPYTVWSTPVNDLSQWSTPGISYSSDQDPHATAERSCMYAPDVVQGNDGRFYLYYCLDGYAGPISVAVCDTPDGKYQYLGDVRDSDGSPYRRFVAFDPAVINDGGTIRLYYGTWYPFEDGRTPENSASFDQLQTDMFHKSLQELQEESGGVMGPVTVQLADDMLTVISEPKRIMPVKVKGTPWEAHPFYEGASIRKIGGLHYFIYSSWLNHELCYATSEKPDEGFIFRGTIISNGDVGYQGRELKDRLNATGNNHGSIECVNGQWYVFYHRQTHTTEYSRQACAEPIEILPDGTISQVEMTSCGLNGGPLEARGTYPAAMCCNLTHGRMPHKGTAREDGAAGTYPYISSENGKLFIHNIENDTWIGYKYFAHQGSREVEIIYRGSGAGRLSVSTCMGGEPLAGFVLDSADTWTSKHITVPFPTGKSGIFFHFEGNGTMDLLSFALS